AAGLDYPNGLALSKADDRLFVAESYQNRILEFKVAHPGRATQCRVFAQLPVNTNKQPAGNLPDGLKLDTTGNLWVAHYGMGALQVLDDSGRLVATIPTGVPLTSNLCFLNEYPRVV